MTDQELTNPRDLLSNLTFCVFDLETTGGNHKNDKIIEIGMVRIVNLEIVETRDFLIQPEIRIPDFIQKLTSISPNDVKDSPVIEDVIDELLEFMGDSILVAHNTSFDIPFFNSVLRRLGKEELKNRSLCTNLMTKYLVPNLMNSNLNYMSKIFDIHHKKAHRALDDAMATAQLLTTYLHIFIDKEIQKINHLYYPRNRYELDRVNFKKGSPLEEISTKLSQLKAPGLVTLKGENGIILYALPFRGSKNDQDLILEKVKELDWETFTIKLHGPLIEILIHFNNLFTKLDNATRSEIIKHLWKEYLPGKQAVHRSEMSEDLEGPMLGKDFGDFLIVNHLVPEQLIIYPIQSMHPKSELIFRYPGHRKKLLQYINSKSSRLSANKLKRPHFNPLLREFLESYLVDCKEKGKELFIFKKNLPFKKQDEFFKEFDEFLTKNPNPYNYPKDYI
ncbi:MAG: 3'-5' exonuclease [Bacteriovoracaceae bacterium]|nr:3'-5' exonuclease [Bacteriovoracaceae bacterium]